MRRVDLSSYGTTELLSLHSEVLEELRVRNVVRSKNNPTGDYAEWLVSEKLGLKLVPNSSKGYDATDKRGRKYQIKGRRVTTGSNSPLLGAIRNYQQGDFDFLVAVVFEADWQVRCAAQVAHKDLEQFLTFRAHVNAHTMRFAPNLFQNRCVKNITDALHS
jgi:hypothetical protein